jgi:hypothetical protein
LGKCHLLVLVIVIATVAVAVKVQVSRLWSGLYAADFYVARFTAAGLFDVLKLVVVVPGNGSSCGG